MYYLGVDLGGTNIAVGLVSKDGTLLYKESVPTNVERGPDPIIKDMANTCLQLLKNNNIPLEQVNSIGIGIPGTSDTEKGEITYTANLPFKNTQATSKIQQIINLPVYFENDANCAALGESISGAAKGYDDSITITLGTGIGGGIIMDKKIFSGYFGGGGEVGHHVMIFDGEPCLCGRKGCWEKYASASALVREAKNAAVLNPNSALSTLVQGDLTQISGKTIFEAYDLGDETARNMASKYFEYVACGLTNLIAVFQPQIIALGGGICGQGDKILSPITKFVESEVYGGELKTKIVIATLGNDAGIIGAAMLGVNN